MLVVIDWYRRDIYPLENAAEILSDESLKTIIP